MFVYNQQLILTQMNIEHYEVNLYKINLLKLCVVN